MGITNFSSKVQAFIDLNHLMDTKDNCLIAVSGGVDSMVLAHTLKDLGYATAIAHVNFQLRGLESDADAAFVRAYAKKQDLLYYQLEVDTEAYAKKEKLSIQEAAREIRYAWLEEIRKKNQAQWIVVGHHKNDLAETMLFNLTRGTGLAGLRSIQAKNGQILRPLLFAERHEILTYAKKQNLQWREDSSNVKTKYSRNLIRHEVLPKLAKINNKVVEHLYHTSLLMNDISLVLKSHLEIIKENYVQEDADQIRIDISAIKTLTTANTLLFYLLQEHGFNTSQVQDILATRTSSKVFLSPKKRGVIHGKYLLISNFAEGTETTFLLESWSKAPIKTVHFTLSWEIKPYYGQRVPQKVDLLWLDADKLTFPLTLRKRKAGDSFKPIGMKGQTKKVKDFLTDRKLSLLEKERLWLLTSANEQIAWLVGIRPDERFKVTGNTQKIIAFTLTGYVE